MKRFDENNLGTEANGFNSHPASRERLANLSKQARENNHANDDKKDNKDNIDNLADILMGY